MPYLYAVQMLIPDYVQPIKIGFSIKPEQRVQSYNSGPFPVRWLGSWPSATRDDEWSTHKRLDRYRMCGEWFFPAPSLLDFINTQLKMPGAIMGRERSTHANEVRLAQRWNLAKLAATEPVHIDWSDESEWLSATFDRSVVSHVALKSSWRI